MYLKAKAINAKIRGKYNLPNAVFCSDLGVLYLNQKEFAKAENLLLEAREIYSMVVGINHPGYATVCQNLAVLYIVQNKLSKAEPLFREVKNIQLEQIDKNFKTLSEKEQQLYYSSLNSYLEGYTSFALVYYQQNASITRDLYDLRLATKGLIFNSTQKTRQQVMNSKDTVLINKFELLNLKRDHLAWQFRLAPEEKQNQNINEAELNSEVNNLEKEIIQLAEKNDLLIAQGERLTWQDIKEKLNKGEAAVEVIRTIKSEFDKEIMYAALIITSNTKEYPELVMFESGSSLEGRGINYYRNCILHQIEDNESYDLFWKPVSEKLKGIKKVYFSPDGVYYQMNLETLKNPTSGSYLFNDLKIQVVGSTQDIVKPNKLSNSTKALIFGFPNYTGDETIGKIQPLPGTEIEVKSIDKLFKGSRFSSTLLIGKEANEKNLKGARNPKFLHIATHGFFLPDLNQDKNLDSNYSVVENPLLRSGLLLANCEANPISQKDEDGTLTAYEAMNLYLDQTDLVVLSACETGLGTIQNGEGVFGLQRAFQQAGAKSVIFSLWKVSDLATQLLMTIFYKEYLKTNNLDQSFIVAKNMVRKDYPQPYYWGSFIIVGK